MEEEKIDDQTPPGMAASKVFNKPTMGEEEMKGLGDDHLGETWSPTAPMPVDSANYNMNYPDRGRMVIFNNRTFKNLPPRKGSEVDVEILMQTFEVLGFKTELHDDLTKDQIEEKLEDLSKEDHSSEDCLVIAVMTHGDENNRLHAKDDDYSIDELWAPFSGSKCPTLAGKPKWFIINACRGEKLDGGIRLETPSSEPDGSKTSMFCTIPIGADFLFAFSTFRGFYSWRSPDEGSYFIRSLCKELKANAGQVHLLDLLTDVARNMALHFESDHANPDYDKKKQVSNLSSTLLGKVSLDYRRSPTAPMPVDTAKYTRGKLVVFDHRTFKDEIRARIGSEVDVEILMQTFEVLGFETELHVDLTKDQIKKKLEDLSKQDYSSEDCLVIAVMTHGDENSCLLAKDDYYSIDELWEPFSGSKCPTLAGKPKWFIINAPRGGKLDGGIRIVNSSSETCGLCTIPIAADLLFLFSTFRGFYSYRNPDEGSYFIQSLCKKLKANAGQVDLLNLLTDVAHDVALHFETNNPNPNYDKKKQVCNISSTLLRKVRLHPKY